MAEATKRCSRCGEWKPKTAEHFRPYGGSANAGQFQQPCLDCRSKRAASQGGSRAQRRALDDQMRRLAALERTEVYRACLADAATRPRVVADHGYYWEAGGP